MMLSFGFILMLSHIYLFSFRNRLNNWYKIHFIKRRVAQFVIIVMIVNSIKLIMFDLKMLGNNIFQYNGFNLLERSCFAVMLFIIIRIKKEFK